MSVTAQRQPFDQAPARLLAAAGSLAVPRDAIDDAFVSAGNKLSECASILSRLTATFEALPAELESPELAAATDRLALVGRRARAIADTLATEQEDIARLVQVVASASHPIDELRRQVKMMSIVAINARVIAAGIVTDTDDFDVFTTDIAKLSDRAAATIAEFAHTYQQLASAVREAASARGSFETTHRATLSALAAELESGLAEVTAQRRRSIEISADTGRTSRDIEARVATAVMALQVGDSTRQRVEHVETALRELAAADPVIVPAIAELQRLQLISARESLSAEMASGEAALGDLARDATRALAQVRDTHGAGGGSGLASLQGALQKAVVVLRGYEVEREKLDKVANAVAETVRVLLGHVEAVQDVEYEMRLVSLNAAVKCAQLGPRGRALDVISSQLRTLTGETVGSAHSAVERLNEAASVATAFTAATGDIAATRTAAMEQEAVSGLDLLAAIGVRMATAMRDLDRDGPVIARRITEAMHYFGEHDAISEALSDVEFTLTDLAGPGDVPADYLGTLRKRYTMDMERRIHDRFAGAPPPAAEPEPAETNLDDLLF
jgi:hypothetical protein